MSINKSIFLHFKKWILKYCSLLCSFSLVDNAAAYPAGLFKQATQGDCDQKEPSVFSVQSHAKWYCICLLPFQTLFLWNG